MKNFFLRRGDAMRLLGMWGLKSPAVGGEVLLPTGAKLVHTRGRLRWYIGGYAHDGSDTRATIFMLL